MTNKVVEKKKSMPKKVEKTTTPKKATTKKTAVVVENKFQVVGLDELLNKATTAATTPNTTKKGKKVPTFDEKGDKLVQQILSFFKIEGITNIKLNELSKLENEIKIKNYNSKIIKKVSNNYTIIMELFERLLEDNEITALGVLLVITRIASSYNSPNLVSKIIKSDKINMVEIICKYFIDLSSDNLIQLIQYTINHKTFTNIKKELESNPTSTLTNPTSQHSSELDLLLSLPLLGGNNINSIRTLSIDSILLLLKYLYSRISLYSLQIAQESSSSSSTTTEILSLKQIVDWISVIFDSHFQELITKIENINHYFGPIRSLQNNTKSFFYTKSFIDFLEKSSLTKSIENNDYSIYHYKF